MAKDHQNAAIAKGRSFLSSLKMLYMPFQLEQIYLKRCTKKERSTSILNYSYVRRTLVLHVVDFMICNVFLMMSFSLKY